MLFWITESRVCRVGVQSGAVRRSHRNTTENTECWTFTPGWSHASIDLPTWAVSLVPALIRFLLKVCVMDLLGSRRLLQPQKGFCWLLWCGRTWWRQRGGRWVSSLRARWTAWCCESWPVKVTWGWTWPGSSGPGWSAAPASGGSASWRPSAPVSQPMEGDVYWHSHTRTRKQKLTCNGTQRYNINREVFKMGCLRMEGEEVQEWQMIDLYVWWCFSSV